MSKRYKRFLEMLSENPNITNTEIADRLDITERHARRYRVKLDIATGTKKDDEYVYLLHCEGFYKIGRAKDVDKRVVALNIGTPFEITVVSKFLPKNVSASSVEAAMHRIMQEYRVKGEWFLFDFDDVLERFESLVGVCDKLV